MQMLHKERQYTYCQLALGSKLSAAPSHHIMPLQLAGLPVHENWH